MFTLLGRSETCGPLTWAKIPAESDMLITNPHIINEGHETAADLLIKNGRIEKIAKKIDAPAGAEVFDADGHWLLPGVIDDQVHFREPGLTHTGDLHSESSEAVAGGTTSYVDRPNNKPGTTTRQKRNSA